MSKFAGLVCALVLGSILTACSSVEPQRMMYDDHHMCHHNSCYK